LAQNEVAKQNSMSLIVTKRQGERKNKAVEKGNDFKIRVCNEFFGSFAYLRNIFIGLKAQLNSAQHKRSAMLGIRNHSPIALKGQLNYYTFNI